MFHRFRILHHFLLAGLTLSLVACGSDPELNSIVISPTTFTTTLVVTASGASAPASQQIWTQYTAIGYYGNAKRQTAKDITSQVTWVSQTPLLVTIDGTGVARVAGTATGFTGIYAQAKGFTGMITSNTSTFTVNLPTSTNFRPSNIVSLAVVPLSSAVAQPGSNIGFSVIGTTADGQQEDLTAESALTSSDSAVATVNARTGLGSVKGIGTTAITATYKNPDGMVVTGYTKFPVGQLQQ
jgi:trimeric autotransporter adhesin